MKDIAKPLQNALKKFGEFTQHAFFGWCCRGQRRSRHAAEILRAVLGRSTNVATPAIVARIDF